jgi:hypothetical protein
MVMAPISVGFGVVLAALGIFYYFPEQRSVTALIPAFFGGALIVLGLLGFKGSLRKHVMHLAALLGVVGFLFPAVRAFPSLPKYFGGELEHPAAIAEQALMAVICLVFTALCVNSFIEARKARARQTPE